MDGVKEETSLKMLCNACLCIANTLYQVTNEKLKRYYLSALNEIPLCNMPVMSPVVCVDCSALLKKTYNFREQVKDSYRILMTYTSESLSECLLTDVSRMPRLSIEHNDSINIESDSNNTANSAEGCMEEILKTSSSKHEISKADQDESQKIEDDVLSPKETPSPCDIEFGNTQVFVKEELKVEDFDSDGDADFDIPLVDLKQYNSLTEVTDSQTNITNELDQTEIQMTEKKNKRIKLNKKNAKVKKKKKDEDIPNILTIHLSYEEMMGERQKELEREGYIGAEFKCETCIVGFGCSKSYKKHLLSRHSENIGKYSCPICKTVSATVESFSTHYKRHMKRFECGVCRTRAADMKSIRQHYFSTHHISLKQYKCLQCGKISNTADAHRYHTETHKSRVPCADCDKTFRHRGGLLNHRLTVHEARNKFPCSLCGKVFRWKNSLKRHMPVHDLKSAGAAGAAWCARCSVSFASVASYRRHLANSLRHVTKDHFRFICDHCNGRFADKTKLRDHIEEKHLHKTYTCTICQKRFGNRVNLEQHARNVHRARPNNNMCHHCGKGFPTKAQLESHMRTHTGERPYICEYCPTTFSQHSNLYKHNRQVHMNMKSKRYPSGKKPRENQIPLPLEPAQIPIHYPLDIQFTM